MTVKYDGLPDDPFGDDGSEAKTLQVAQQNKPSLTEMTDAEILKQVLLTSGRWLANATRARELFSREDTDYAN